jgi:beta-galactosidase/beta-glucuronidase
MPADWPHTIFINFTGVDDHYRLYVNGRFIGQSGDIENRLTAFDEHKSYDISEWARPGAPAQIAVEVFDWYGAGGLFRPVTISTKPISNRPTILK